MTARKGVLIGVVVLALVLTPVHGASVATGPGESAARSPEPAVTDASPAPGAGDIARVGTAAPAPADGASLPERTTDSDVSAGTTDSNVSTGTSTGAPSDGASHGVGTIRVDRRLFLTPADDRNVTVETTVTLPEDVVDFDAGIGASLAAYPYRVVSTANVTYHPRTDRLTMNSSRGQTTTGSFTFEVGVNRSDGYATGTVDTAETDSWALVEDDQYDVDFSYRYFGGTEPHVSRATTVAGDGYATNRYAFLGPVTTYRRTANGQAFTLVVSDDATPERAPDRILASLADASARLTVGDRDPSVTTFVVSNPIRRGGRGGGDTFWVHEESTGSTAVHEYVHTRQAWIDADSSVRTESTVEWITEASADYYQAYLHWRAGNMTSAAFRADVATDQYADQILQDDDDDSAESKNYFKGRRVLAALDARIRNRTNGKTTFMDAFAAMNSISGETLDYGDLRGAVVARTDEATGQWLDRYVTSREAPDIPQDVDAAYAPTASNQPPTADAGANATATGGATVTLDGTASSDPDGDSLAFAWRQVDGPSVGLSGAGTASPTFAAPDVDATTRLAFELEVSDGSANDTDTVVVTVEPADSGGGQHESGVSQRVFDAVAGADGMLDRPDVIAMVRGYVTTESVDGVAVTRADVLALVRYYVVNS